MKIKIEVGEQEYVIEKPSHLKENQIKIYLPDPIAEMKSLSIRRTAVNCVILGVTYKHQQEEP